MSRLTDRIEPPTRRKKCVSLTGLIKDEEHAELERDLSSLEHVHQTSRGGHEKVAAAVEIPHLFGVIEVV